MENLDSNFVLNQTEKKEEPVTEKNILGALDSPPVSNEIEQKEEPVKKKNFLDVLKLFSPGTSLRLAIDDILRARMGALIAIENEKLLGIIDGGFKVNSKFSAQKIVELAKMDGAIILSNDLKKILYANALLFPSVHLPTKETGTRHKAAERTARHADTIVIAVSERKNKITIYSGNIRHELNISSEILRRAAESLQILEKQKEIFNDLISNFNLLEMNGLVMVRDVSEVLQRMEMIRRVSDKIKRYLIELGKEGMILSMRLQELTQNLTKEREHLLRDYFRSRTFRMADTGLNNMNFDSLINLSSVSEILFKESFNKSIFPRGIRILNKTTLKEKEVESLIKKTKTLNEIFNMDFDALATLFGEEALAKKFKEDLENLRERVLVGKKI